MQRITISTPAHACFVDITSVVARAAAEQGVAEGVVTVFVPHTTCGLTINENADPDVVTDMLAALERMVPWKAGYQHGEGNSAAHLKASMMGFSLTILVADGQLQLGTWQGIYLCEFDGPRVREVWVQAPAAG
jgi:secondary thiamine-phosphate synthase enzyme